MEQIQNSVRDIAVPACEDEDISDCEKEEAVTNSEADETDNNADSSSSRVASVCHSFVKNIAPIIVHVSNVELKWLHF